MPVIETRYAEAFLGSAKSAEAADEAGALLSDFSELWRGNEELKFFMSNPVVPDSAKKDTVVRIFSEDGLNPAFKNFIFLLIDKKRLLLIPEISGEYARLKNKYRNGIVITAWSQEALDGERLDRIREKYRIQYGASSAEIVNIVDTSLIGGVRIKIGDTLIDDSVSGRLKDLLSAIE